MTNTTFEPSDGTSSENAARARFWRYAASILTNAKRGLAIRKARRQLRALPDCMLKDLGISRCDGDYLAAHGEFAVRLVSDYNRSTGHRGI
jgi:uncharacterized protein YjiS (DUF1127 family)